MKIITKVILTENGFEIHKIVLVLRPFHVFCRVDKTLTLVRPGHYLHYAHLATMCRPLSEGERVNLICYKYLCYRPVLSADRHKLANRSLSDAKAVLKPHVVHDLQYFQT